MVCISSWCTRDGITAVCMLTTVFMVDSRAQVCWSCKPTQVFMEIQSWLATSQTTSTSHHALSKIDHRVMQLSMSWNCPQLLQHVWLLPCLIIHAVEAARHKHTLTRPCLVVQEDFLKGEEGRAPGEQKALPRPPPQMRQALPTDPQSVADFNDSMAAYYHQVLPTKPCPQVLPSSPALLPCLSAQKSSWCVDQHSVDVVHCFVTNLTSFRYCSSLYIGHWHQTIPACELKPLTNCCTIPAASKHKLVFMSLYELNVDDTYLTNIVATDTMQ